MLFYIQHLCGSPTFSLAYLICTKLISIPLPIQNISSFQEKYFKCNWILFVIVQRLRHKILQGIFLLLKEILGQLQIVPAFRKRLSVSIYWANGVCFLPKWFISNLFTEIKHVSALSNHDKVRVIVYASGHSRRYIILLYYYLAAMVMLFEMALLFSILLLIRFLLPSECVGTIQMRLESLKDRRPQCSQDVVSWT